MRIALLGNASVIHTRRWCATFRERGHEVRVWSLEPGPEGFGEQRLPSVPVPGALRYPLALPALRAGLAAFAPDLVDAHFVPNYGLLGALAGRHPLAVVAWGSDLLVSGPRDALQRARARFVLARADAVVADSDNLAAAAAGLGARPGTVHAIPWGIDLARFRPAPERDEELIVSTRMHEPVYDLATLVEGVAPVLARRPRLRLVIGGFGSGTAALAAHAARRLPAGRWELTGRLEPAAMAGLLGRAGIYVSTSRSDSTSVSLLEAMAAGALPVVSDLEGNREWVAEGAGARMFRAGDAAGLAQALERALADPAARERDRARNRAVIAARGDAAANFTRIEALYAGLVARGRAA